MEFLPKYKEGPFVWFPEEYQRACDFCQGYQHWVHKCDAWTHIVPTIQHETRSALLRFAHLNNHTLFDFREHDVVIQQRCAPDTVMSHPEYGPAPLAFYDTMPDKTRRVIVVGDLGTMESSPLCQALNKIMFDYISKRHPSAELIFSSGSIFEDFSKLVFAPTLYKAASSFGLWAALANTGSVHSAVVYKNITFDAPNWHWSEHSTIYPSLFWAAGVLDARDVDGILQVVAMRSSQA